MKRFTCVFCDKKLLVANYKARKMHNNGTKHRQMVRTHYLEILENEKIRKELEEMKKKVENNKKKQIYKEKNEQTIKETPFKQINENLDSFKFVMPPMTIPEDFKIPPSPIGFRLPLGFNFEDKLNFDKNLEKAIKKIKESVRK